MTRDEMNALVDAHYRAEVAGDIDAIVDGFGCNAEHDAAGRPGPALHGRHGVAAYYRDLLAELRIDRFEPVRRWHGEQHMVDESVLHARALGRVFGYDGHGRAVHVRLLHVFEFADGLIHRDSAWLDVAGLQRQLADDGWTAGVD